MFQVFCVRGNSVLIEYAKELFLFGEDLVFFYQTQTFSSVYKIFVLRLEILSDTHLKIKSSSPARNQLAITVAAATNSLVHGSCGGRSRNLPLAAGPLRWQLVQAPQPAAAENYPGLGWGCAEGGRGSGVLLTAPHGTPRASGEVVGNHGRRFPWEVCIVGTAFSTAKCTSVSESFSCC